MENCNVNKEIMMIQLQNGNYFQ